ncbi:MAG TPA: FAD-binding oxidoreductase [Candidatus Acidoferrales bacterium]|nr:FAD-binding oxidoreductase [Candidatus Acidoferrales bacterium]
MASFHSTGHSWGTPPWIIDFTPPEQPLPRQADFAVIGAGFTGLAAAAWLRLLAPSQSVIVLEAGRIGAGASGRTGSMALSETAAGNLPGLGDVLAGLQDILEKLGVECDLSLPGAWEIGRQGGMENSPISWQDSGILRVAGEVPGGTLDPGKLVSGLARAACRRGTAIFEECRVERVRWNERGGELRAARGGNSSSEEISAGKILFATNGLSLPLSGLGKQAHPKLTLAAATAPIRDEQLRAVGLSERKPFYTVDFPYLWGRILAGNAIVWGAGLVDPPESGDLEEIDIGAEESSRLFARLEKRLRNLHPDLIGLEFTHRWGGPILFRDDWKPVFDWHPQSRDGIVLGAFAGHGVALSSYLGAWAAEVLLGRRELPAWGKIAR